MSLFHLIILAIIQGVTEFLPVSSSAHLILLPNLTDLEDQGRFLDVAVHVGTLGAVIVYFWSDSLSALRGLGHLSTGRTKTKQARLALLLIIATVPAVGFGFILSVTGLIDHMRTPVVIGWTMLIFGLVLYVADQFGRQQKRADDWTMRDAIIMGVWQAIALIPGTSRSGATITAARFLGYERKDGTRLAMLMSIPIIIASGTLELAGVWSDANWPAIHEGMVAAALSFIAAIIALVFMMRLLTFVSFTPYVIYRVILGLGLLVWAYA
jgi:undecaprenyl-diphosphatase